MSVFASGNIKTAVRSLRRNRARSLLTMFGIIIGVVSVTLAVGISEGVKQQIDAQTQHLGSDLITIRPGQLLHGSGLGSLQQLGVTNGLSAGGSLGSNDVAVVQQTPGVAQAVPLSLVSGGVRSNERAEPATALVIGTTAGLPAMLRQSLAYGTFFGSDGTAMDKVVIGQDVARSLFDENVPLGQTVTILGRPFIVIGIFNTFQTAPLSIDADFNNAVFIPYDTALTMTHNNSPLYEILARPADITQTTTVVSRLRGRLLAAHGGQADVTVLQQDQTMAVTNAILELLTGLVIGVAAVAFVVGGIGIMNMMLVSVTERMHEIGIRKAIGATTRQIMMQFITEAAILSITGGVVAIAIAYAVEGLLALFTGPVLAITWQAALFAFLPSIVVGIIFGSAPALKAARKDPIAALRNE
ncbi:MAG TPA: ABC transporter permease [Candidatus Saccharimonadales bacterium]|nr:ABC transporter permease [Candidatus Saccharimonadales bacterium]